MGSGGLDRVYAHRLRHRFRRRPEGGGVVQHVRPGWDKAQAGQRGGRHRGGYPGYGHRSPAGQPARRGAALHLGAAVFAGGRLVYPHRGGKHH